MNARKPGARANISHGHITHPPRIAQIICPRRILMYFGKMTIKSLAALMLFADIFAPAIDKRKLNDAKKEAALLSQRSMRWRGSQRMSP